MDVGLDIDTRALMRDLERLPDRVEDRVSRRAVMKGAVPVARAQRREAPVASGTLRRSHGRKARLYRQSGTAVALAGPRITGTHRGFHAHLIERGRVTADGTHVPANPYLQRAQEASETEARRAMLNAVVEGVEKEAAKL